MMCYTNLLLETNNPGEKELCQIFLATKLTTNEKYLYLPTWPSANIAPNNGEKYAMNTNV